MTNFKHIYLLLVCNQEILNQNKEFILVTNPEFQRELDELVAVNILNQIPLNDLKERFLVRINKLVNEDHFSQAYQELSNLHSLFDHNIALEPKVYELTQKGLDLLKEHPEVSKVNLRFSFL